jgi:shikimate dehydrogenase
MTTKKVYALIGYPLSHSFSKKYFTRKFEIESIPNSEYINLEIQDISLLREILVSNTAIQGFSVTIPYKEKIIPYLDRIDRHAQEIGAVNCVSCSRSASGLYLTGYNTDSYGFSESLKCFLTGNERKAMVLGTGGASKAVRFVLKNLGFEIITISRKKSAEINSFSYEEIDEKMVQNQNLIVNATPLGTWPEIERYPKIPYHFIKPGTIAYDLVYNPEKTKFMELAENKGATVVNGLRMLELQAEKAWLHFNSPDYSEKV